MVSGVEIRRAKTGSKPKIGARFGASSKYQRHVPALDENGVNLIRSKSASVRCRQGPAKYLVQVPIRRWREPPKRQVSAPNPAVSIYKRAPSSTRRAHWRRSSGYFWALQSQSGNASIFSCQSSSFADLHPPPRHNPIPPRSDRALFSARAVPPRTDVAPNLEPKLVPTPQGSLPLLQSRLPSTPIVSSHTVIMSEEKVRNSGEQDRLDVSAQAASLPQPVTVPTPAPKPTLPAALYIASVPPVHTLPC
jgi:hypothetical protein